jgi:hypothetical protein
MLHSLSERFQQMFSPKSQFTHQLYRTPLLSLIIVCISKLKQAILDIAIEAFHKLRKFARSLDVQAVEEIFGIPFASSGGMHPALSSLLMRPSVGRGAA